MCRRPYIVWFSIFALASATSCRGPGPCSHHPSPHGPAFAGPDFVVDAAGRDELVTAVLAELDGKYLFPEIAAKNRPELAKRWGGDAMLAATSGRTIMARMNADLQELFKDRHVFLLPVAAVPEAMRRDQEEATPAELAEMAILEARHHFGIASAEVLTGNVGYLELVHFPYVKIPGTERAVAEAMSAIGDTDALIVDLRRNGGGDGDTVTLLLSYLLDHKTLLYESYDRLSGKTTPDWTRADVPGRRYGATRPLWVLTSSRTFSAGEGFAYAVQTLRRGTTVGETTRGGGHYNKFFKVGKHFLLSVAIGTTKSPVTHTNFDGSGVKPDVEARCDDALDVALALARNAIARELRPNRR